LALYFEGCLDSGPIGIGVKHLRWDEDLVQLPMQARIALLREEHSAIFRQLGEVEKSFAKDRQHPQRRRELIDALGGRLRLHFVLEEEIVYRPLNFVLKEDSPTEELMEDHRSIRLAIKKLGRMDTSLREGQASMSDLRYQIRFLDSAFRKHFEKEEKVVFWLAEHNL